MRLAPDVTILPGVQLLGATVVEEDAVVGPDSTLKDVEVGAGARVVRTHGELAVIGAGADVGPFSYLRPGTELGAGGKIGAFVETKNARIGDGAKVPHLTYVGDAEIGEGTNIGAGSVFANYDGVDKHRTVIGRHARTASNTTFVAPVTVGDGASTGAGSVIREDVPPGALAVSAGPQRTIEGWALRKRAGTAQGEAAEAALEKDPTTRPTHDPDAALRCPVGDNRGAPAATRTEEHRIVSGMKRTTEKNLMVFSGRAHPGARRGGGRAARHRAGADLGLRVRQLRDLRALRGVGARFATPS